MRFDDQLDFEKVMAVFAHPDDLEWSSGGTLASWIDQGVEVIQVLVTNGASGSSDPDMTRERLAEIRREEQAKASAVLGISEIVYLDFEDGYLYPDLEARKSLSREIRRHKPDVLVSHDPTARTVGDFYFNHPDHVATGELVMRAINPDASSGLMFPDLWKVEGLAPHLPRAVFLSSFLDGTTLIDVEATIERKFDALRCHASQMKDPDGVIDWARQRFSEIGQRAGKTYAEAFRLFRTAED